MRNLMIALSLVFASLAVPILTLAACADAEVTPAFVMPLVTMPIAPAIKSVATRQDANLGMVVITVYKSTVVDL